METLTGMRLFTKVVEAGSFSAAGRQLGLAVSTISRQVGALETELGTRLLNRSTRSLGLTEAGNLYYERARRIIAEVDDANAAISELTETPRGTLRLNVPVVFGRRYIAPYMREFLELHPAVRVELNVTDNYVDLIEEGADLAIRIGQTNQQSVVTRKLATLNRILCASTAYLKRHGRPERPQDLARHNCLVFYRQRPGAMTWQLTDAEGTIDVAVTGNFTSNNAGAIGAAMAAGIGIALLPAWLVGREVQMGSVEAVLPGYRAHPTGYADEVFAVFPDGRNVPAKVRAYVDFVAEKFRTEPNFRIGPMAEQS
jgi:DNA-binding transcriptional LysR family regulator